MSVKKNVVLERKIGGEKGGNVETNGSERLTREEKSACGGEREVRKQRGRPSA